MQLRRSTFIVCLIAVSVVAFWVGLFSSQQDSEHLNDLAGWKSQSQSLSDEFRNSGNPQTIIFPQRQPAATSQRDPITKNFFYQPENQVHQPSNSEEGVAYLLADGNVQVESETYELTGKEVPDKDAYVEENQANTETPNPLPPPNDAAPIEDNVSVREKLTRSIIESQLPHATEEEREIWFDELKGLGPEMAREILNLRRKIDGKGIQLPRLAVQPLEIDKKQNLHKTVPVLVSPPSLLEPVDSEIIERLFSTFSAIGQARDVILNNIANAKTAGFKRSDVVFADLDYLRFGNQGENTAEAGIASHGHSIGLGVQIAGTRIDSTQGELSETTQPLDLAIVGNGYFQISVNAEILYTRAGTFSLNADGEITFISIEQELKLEPVVVIPKNATSISIAADGSISVIQEGESKPTEVGKIQLARFLNPAGLQQLGGNLFAETDASGPPSLGIPGIEKLGKVQQGFLELSNVDLHHERQDLEFLERQLLTIKEAISIQVPTVNLNGDNIPQQTVPDSELNRREANNLDNIATDSSIKN